ncbi:MAG: DUF1365 domain-containing protein [Leptospiraceae bacterium]|nr:DUF1365 domain-containing protein [Leptospiraceae bacterium]MCP5502481.1 DUF1365 domain-containing protein [Leptospiraceae bacterium]
MDLNSKIYDCVLSHHRLFPKKNSFTYKAFTFFLDLDEIESISKKMKLFSKGKFNLFSFAEQDHILLGNKNLKDSIIQLAKENGVNEKITKVYLLTNLRILGYVFNPVSFYFCLNQDKLLCAVAEVNNTFGERKPYFIPLQEDGKSFYLKTPKYFYVSPFLDLDMDFEFKLNFPKEKLNLTVNTLSEGRMMLLSNYKGKEILLSDSALLKYFFIMPFFTLKVIFLIHWQAFILLLKKIPYHKKDENIELQKGVHLGKDI